MGPSPALLMRHRIMRNRWMTIGLLVVAGLALVALAAPWLAPRDPYHGQLVVALREPSPAYLFGTDAQGRDVLDRKSTRLNSSHSQISYAVFCLKKKKNRRIIDDQR